MITIENIHHSFGSRKVLDGVSCRIPAGEIVGLIGPSGGGKSTLLKLLGRAEKVQHGTVNYGESDEEHISLMFQEGALFDSLNVFDNVAFPLVRGKVPTTLLSRRRQEEVHARVDGILARVGLSKAAYKMPGQISGGMRRRTSLARALVARPKIALLDDPTSGLDPVASSVIMELIVELHGEYKPTTIMVSHDLRRLLPVVQTILYMSDGKIRFQGTLDELRRLPDPEIRRFVSCRYDLSSEPSADSSPASPG